MLMRTCERCGSQVDAESPKCPHCLWWSDEVLVKQLQHPNAAIRERAGFDAVYVDRTQRLIRGLAAALRDPVTPVRQQAGVALFICGREAEAAIPELIEALADSDLIVRRVAAAALSMIGPPAIKALPALSRIRDSEDEQLHEWINEAERAIAGK
jgi:HEAT repeat protein